MNLKSKEWNKSFSGKDNHVFYPHEEIIRFTSKYIRKKTGISDYIDCHSCPENPKVIDLGCGIGRHVKFFDEYNLDCYGIDLSEVALKAARQLFNKQNLTHLNEKLFLGSLTEMPFQDNFFDFAVSHGVYDSMPFDVAKKAMQETSRCLKNGALFYLDLVSGDDSNHAPEFCGEEVVETAHEKGTIQSFFNWSKIADLLGDTFTVKEAFLIKNTSIISSRFHSRYHLILENLSGTPGLQNREQPCEF